jgi:hypothetical protein
MEDHLIAIENDITSGNYYSAVFLAITIPSICAALESVDGKDTQSNYINWYNTYVQNLILTGADCYKLRCSLLHQASTSHSGSTLERVIFTFPHPNGNTFHNNKLNGALNLDIPLFCSEMVNGARNWLMQMDTNQNYKKNVPNIIRIYPEGLPPYFSGHPVIS